MKPFHFKNFSIHQEHSALKVGTDAMLLGAIAHQEAPNDVLDIGTGNGVLTLMLAQKYPTANFLAIDIDEESLIDCQKNFEIAPWSNQLSCRQQDVLTITEVQQFDLIISNPPFYEGSLKGENDRLNTAKHTSENFLQQMFLKVTSLLKPNGSFWIILPSDNFGVWEEYALTIDLFLDSKLMIQSKESIDKRVIARFTLEHKSPIETSILVIRNKDNSYTEEYKFLTKEYHSVTL